MEKTVAEQLVAEMNQSRKMRSPSRFFYYRQLLENVPSAVVSWEQFRGSWAYSMFNTKHRAEIQAMIESDNHRFPWARWIDTQEK